MPLDKMPDPDEFVMTHNSMVLHMKDAPVACIIDNGNDFRYKSFFNDRTFRSIMMGFLAKDDELGLLMGFKLKIQIISDFLEYTIYPTEEFIDIVILNESIHFVNNSMDDLFSLRHIMTDQFVKTKFEFEKFKKMM